MSNESMNMLTIGVGSMLNVIREHIEDEMYNTPLLFLGKSGIGKTESVMALAKEMGIAVKEYRLITTNETELMGIPSIEKDAEGHSFSTYAPNELLPNEERDGERGILLFDEITSCTANVRTAAMQLMDVSRKVGTYRLPKKWLIVCLGNGEEDGGNFNGMEFAFLNRCICYNVECVLDCTDPSKGLGWIQWALANNVNSSVISFVRNNPDLLHKFNTDDPASLFPSPRSWTILSRKLNLREDKNGGKPLAEQSSLIYSAGTVGASAGRQFSIYYKCKADMVDVDDILTGKIRLQDVRMERSALQMTYTSLIQKLFAYIDPDMQVTPESIRKGGGQLSLSNKTIGYLSIFIDIIVNASAGIGAGVREDAIFLWDNFTAKYGNVAYGALPKVPNYNEFRASKLYAELSLIKG